MATNSNTRACTHIKVNGIRCGSPSLREEVFCYFHQRMIRGVRTPPQSRLHPIANFEDAQAIQASLMEVVNALARNHIDVPRARLILRALSIAVRNAGKARFDCWQSDMVKDVPEYPAALPVADPFKIPAAPATVVNSSQATPFTPAPVESRRKVPISVKIAPRARSENATRTG
jgi:hypothetical protein